MEKLPPAEKPNAPAGNAPQQPPASKPEVPKAESQSKPPQKPITDNKNLPLPQTGGSFPIFFAVGLVIVTLLARYLRGQRHRRV